MVQKITNQELKILDKDFFDRLINSVKTLLKINQKDQEVNGAIEQIQLDIALRISMDV